MFDIHTYSWALCVIHIALAFILFFILNWIGKKSLSVGYVQMDLIVQEDTYPAFNFLFKVVSPAVYIILLAVLFQSLQWNSINTSIFLISVYYWIIRILWIMGSSRVRLVNWPEFLLFAFFSIGLSYYINTLIDKVETILPEPRALLDQMWILIIAFLYSIFNSVHTSRKGSVRRKKNYIFSRFELFHKRYDKQIHTYWDNPFYEAVTYSIMIYEDFNRSAPIRCLEYVSFFLSRKKHTLGIMQFSTNKYINDVESINLAMHKIKNDSQLILDGMIEKPQYKWDYAPRAFVNLIAEKYNGGDYHYSEEINNIFEQIQPRYFTDSISPIVEKFGEYDSSK